MAATMLDHKHEGSRNGDLIALDDIHPAGKSVTLVQTEVTLEQERINNLDYSGAHEKIDPREIALVRKLDRWIMPPLWLMYWLNYLDRNAMAFAKLNSIVKDCKLVNEQYQTCISILFVGYILGQIPSNMFITRTRPSYYMAGAMALWATVSALTAVANDYAGLLLTRFFLGVTEAPYYPGTLYILSIFYTRKEIATRIAIIYLGNILATAFAGLIAAGIFHGLDQVAGLPGWRWLFIIQGAVTFVVAIAAAFMLPNDPLHTRWLTTEERQLAHNRILKDTVGSKSNATVWEGLRQAATDYKVWIFAFMQHMHLAANGFINFFPSVVQTLGFGTTITLVLTSPPYLIAGLFLIWWSWSSGKHNERTWHIMAAKTIAILGFILGCASLNTGARYFAMTLFTIGTYAVPSIIYGWVGATCGQTKEKKSAALAMVNTLANISFIWTPYLWLDSGAPRYTVALSSSAAFSAVTAITAWYMKSILTGENRRLRRESQERTLFYAY